MKISDFGLSRDVYEEDSYVKRSKVRFSLEIGTSQTESVISVSTNHCFLSLPGPYSCKMDGYRVTVWSHLHNTKWRVSTLVVIWGVLDDFLLGLFWINLMLFFFIVSSLLLCQLVVRGAVVGNRDPGRQPVPGHCSRTPLQLAENRLPYGETRKLLWWNVSSA